jgi:hypothetical protein
MTLQEARSIARHLGLTLRQLRSARARSVLNNDRLAKPLRQWLTDEPREQIHHAARWEWRDQPHRPCWIGLRPRDARHGRQRGSARGEM